MSLSDQNPGIPGYAQDKVFEKFYSLVRPHSRKRSTGLGLSFVKEIASMHRGSNELGNRPEAGGHGRGCHALAAATRGLIIPFPLHVVDWNANFVSSAWSNGS